MSDSIEFFRTTSVSDFKVNPTKDMPKGYPQKNQEDVYSKYSFEKSYALRKAYATTYYLNCPGPLTPKGIYGEILRLQQDKGPVHMGLIEGSINYVNQRRDCSDFTMNGFLRLYYQFKDSKLLDKDIVKDIKKAILDFKYWPDEPGVDSMCYWTENHHIMFSTCEYLAGQLFPDEVFTNSNQTGKEKMIRAKKRIEKWIELRYYTGFSEWLSNVYFDESMPPLINLYDLAEDEEIKRKAKGIIDLMFYDMALNNYYGIFSSTHGRTYTEEKLNPLKEDTIDTAKLVFGIGKLTNKNNMTAPLLLVSNYEIPEIIVSIANSNEAMINKARVSIKFKDRKIWGYHKKNEESAMGLLAFGGYAHPQTFNYLTILLDRYHWWENKFFLEFKPFKKIIKVGRHIGLTNLVATILKKDLSRNSMTEANLYTYKTKDYMLSTAQDYLKTMGGDQHHIWQATLDNQAIVFTTHPGGYKDSAPDGYWHGNGFMPKSIQFKNINITMYNTPRVPAVVIEKILPFTHIFFPKSRYDQVVEKNGWIMGKANDGYVAIYSSHAYKWITNGKYKDQEVIVDGRKNVYITELGSKDVYGSFEAFVELIAKASIQIRGLKVIYISPSAGKIKTSFKGKTKIGDKVYTLNNYDRYDNKTSYTKFMDDEIVIKHQDDVYKISKSQE
jgi:hypothetical protein